MTSSPKVSIFIPCFNCELYIEEAIRSAYLQDYLNIEIIICNDASTDKSLQIIEQVSQELNEKQNKQVISTINHEINKGIAATWNTCLKHCEGEFALQLDADDKLYEQTVSILLPHLTKDKSLSAIFADCDFIGDIKSGADICPLTMPTFNKEYLFYNDMNITHPRMFRMESWRKTSGADESLTDAVDYDIMVKLAEVGDIKYIPENLYHYRIHENQTTRKNSQSQKKNAQRVRTNSFKRRQTKISLIEKELIKGPEDFSSFIIRKKIRQLREKGIQSLVIYGAGKHTQKHLSVFQSCELDILAFLDDHAKEGQSLDKWPVKKLEECLALKPDAILISSDSSENKLYENLKTSDVSIPAHKLYS